MIAYQENASRQLAKATGLSSLSEATKAVIAEVAAETDVNIIEKDYGYFIDFDEVSGVLIVTDEGIYEVVDIGGDYYDGLDPKWREDLMRAAPAFPNDLQLLRGALRKSWYLEPDVAE